jgi:uncharacterized repeat protein (TIGR03803 family)
MSQIQIKRTCTWAVNVRLACCVAVSAMLALGMLFGAAEASAQTYTDIHDFDGTLGSSPASPQLLVQGRDGNLYGTTPYGGNNSGVVFKITPNGALSVIYNFDGTAHGSRPDSGLAMGTDGNFYGTTLYGGPNNVGTIFQVTPAGAITTLYKFTDGSDGAYPYAPPTLGPDGNFYGVTQAATAYKITPSGTFKLLGSIPDRSFAPLLLGADGSFYGTTQHGGKLNLGAVFRMTTAGKVTTIYSFDGTHGSVPIGCLAQAADGAFYGTTSGGGSGNGGVVFRVTKGGSYKVLHNFPTNSASDGNNPIAGLVAATDGNFYGDTFAGGSDNLGIVFQTTPAGKNTVVFNMDKTRGSGPGTTQVQHTNGIVYGMTGGGGNRNDGVVYSVDLGASPFVKLVLSSGKVGATVQVLGAGFDGATKVKFNGASSSFTIVSDTYLTAKVPAGATTGPVTVTTSASTLTSSTKFRVIPKVVSFNPTSGTVGTTVTIKGNSFTGATAVTFGGVKATTFTVNSDTQITAEVPTGAKTGKIAVTTPGGTGTSSGVFTVTQ